MKDFLKKQLDQFRGHVDYFRMEETDRRILTAEREMIRAYATWQALLAARRAEVRAKEETAHMIRDERRKFEYVLK